MAMEMNWIADILTVSVIAPLAALFLLHERPCLIDLHVLDGNVSDLPTQ